MRSIRARRILTSVHAPALLFAAGALAHAQLGRLSAPGPGTPSGREPTNVLILLADDLGVDNVGAYGLGSDLPPTPNLDALAAEGVRFTNAWSQPICSPTRATIQTGRLGFRTTIGSGISTTTPGEPALPLSEITIPEMLNQGTGGIWSHAAIGKWHLGSDLVGGEFAPNLAGYDHYEGNLEADLSGAWSYFNWQKTIDGVTQVTTKYATTDAVDSALAWIQTHTEPWFCYVAFNAPHSPWHAPPANLHTQDLSNPTNRDLYRAMVEALDTEIGRLLASIPKPVLRRTLVIFLGDNGTDAKVTVPPFVPSHAKTTLYQGGVNVPLIVTGPQVAGPGVSNALVHTADLFATVAAVAGVNLETQFPGVTFDSISLLPYLQNPSFPSQRAWVVSELFTPNGPGNPPPAPACPPPVVCQPDAGFGGPGTVTISACGDPLHGGNSEYGASPTAIQLTGAPPFAVADLYVGPYNPTPMLGGTIVPFPPTSLTTYTTDVNGDLTVPIVHSGHHKPATNWYQFTVVDPSQAQGYAISNALQVDKVYGNCRAIRDGQYKLLVNIPLCTEQFFDTLADPFEQTDLLLGTLTEAQQASYNFLKNKLADLSEE